MSKLKIPSRGVTSVVRRYGLAVVSVATALGLGLLIQGYTPRDVEIRVFPVCYRHNRLVCRDRACRRWRLYSHAWPSLTSSQQPLYSLYITPSDVPYFIIYTLFGLLIAGFSTVRRRIEQELRQARDELETEVAERTQQASLLNLTHDTIFVRDMSDVITYWNRGAQELYGWTAEEAIGKRAHQLLQTVFPVPIDAIRAELLRADRWEGELEKTKADGTQVVVASRWSLRRDEQERPVAVLETNNDITERKRTEGEIRTTQRRTCQTDH